MRRCLVFAALGLLACTDTHTGDRPAAVSSSAEDSGLAAPGSTGGVGSPGSSGSTAAATGVRADASAPSQPPADAAAQRSDAAIAVAPCGPTTRAGDPCDAAPGDTCIERHCGAQHPLVCVDGTWQLQADAWGGDGAPSDFMCADGFADASGYCDNPVQCCGEEVEQTHCPWEGGCSYCPADEPKNGDPCSLPDACDGSPGLRVIDCYYSCCCYGGPTWAQCDGTSWHVTTSCTSK